MMDWEEGEVIRRQGLFSTALIRQFMKKICKYQNLMLKHNVNITDSGYGSSIHTSRSFDDDIELVLKENSSTVDSCKSFWNLGARLSVLRLFQWVSKIVQRTKAARILCHIDAIPESEIESTIIEVARELSVAFEYQILMLYGDSEVIKLADHAVSCLTTYLNSCDSAFSCSNLLQAILEVKPLTGNKKDVVRTKVVTFNDSSVCLHWKLWQIFKQTGLRIPADCLEIKIEKKTPIGPDTACSTQRRSEGTDNVECVVTVEEPNICFVSVETKTKNAEQKLDESARCNNMEKLRDEENEQPSPGTAFGKSIKDFEQEIHGDITSVEEEMLDTLSESYSSEDAIVQETNDNRNTAINEDTVDSVQETLEKENVLSQERGDKLTSPTKFTENIFTANEIHNDIQPANDSESVVATADTLGIFREVIYETDRCNENVFGGAVPVATDEVCNSSEENVGTFKERVSMEDILSYIVTSESLQERLTTQDAVMLEDNQGSEQGTEADDDKVVVESPKITRDKELDFIKGQYISLVFETTEINPSKDRNIDVGVDMEHTEEFHSAATSGPAKEFGVNYDIDNNSSQEIVNDSHILSATVQAGDIAKKIVHDATNNCFYTKDTSNCHNVTSKYVIQGEIEDSFNINDCLLEDDSNVAYEHDTQRTNIPENLSNQVTGTQVIEEIKENALASENSKIFRCNDIVFDTQTNYILESQLDQVIGDHAIIDIEENVPMSPSSAIPKQDTHTNHIPKSQLDQVIGDHVIEDIEENVPMTPSSAIPKQDTQINYIPESQLDQVTGDHIIEDIKQNVPMSGHIISNNSAATAVSEHDTEINISESQSNPIIAAHAMKDMEQNVPMPGHKISNNSAISKHDTKMIISESQLNHVIPDHAVEDIEQNIAYRFYGCFTPYGAKCRPNIYGFRGPLHIWNEDEGKYTLVYNDRVTVVNCRARQIPLTEGNIHQAYIPKSFCKH